METSVASNVIFTLLSLFFLLGSVCLVLIILIQKPQGGGLSAAFGAGGGGASQTAFGAKTGDILTLVTVGIFVFFLVVSCVLVRVSQARYGSNVQILAPSSPAEVTAVAQSADSIQLTWADQSDNEDRFKISRSMAEDGEYAFVEAVEPDHEIFIDTGLQPGTTYYYRITAENAGGESGATEPVQATTLQAIEGAEDGESEAGDDAGTESGIGDSADEQADEGDETTDEGDANSSDQNADDNAGPDPEPDEGDGENTESGGGSR